MTVSKKEGIWAGLLEDSIRHHRPPAIMALTNLVRLVMWRNLKKHVEDEVVLPPLTVSNETVTSSSAESVLYAHRYHEMRGMLERELRARKARGEFAARDDVDEAAKLRFRLCRGTCHGDAIAIFAEIALQQLTQPVVIVDYQDMRRINIERWKLVQWLAGSLLGHGFSICQTRPDGRATPRSAGGRSHQ